MPVPLGTDAVAWNGTAMSRRSMSLTNKVTELLVASVMPAAVVGIVFSTALSVKGQKLAFIGGKIMYSWNSGAVPRFRYATW